MGCGGRRSAVGGSPAVWWWVGAASGGVRPRNGAESVFYQLGRVDAPTAAGGHPPTRPLLAVRGRLAAGVPKSRCRPTRRPPRRARPTRCPCPTSGHRRRAWCRPGLWGRARSALGEPTGAVPVASSLDLDVRRQSRSHQMQLTSCRLTSAPLLNVGESRHRPSARIAVGEGVHGNRSSYLLWQRAPPLQRGGAQALGAIAKLPHLDGSPRAPGTESRLRRLGSVVANVVGTSGHDSTPTGGIHRAAIGFSSIDTAAV